MSINAITSEGVTALSQVIKCNHLQHIGLSYCKSFPKSPGRCLRRDSLQTLCLSGNRLAVNSMAKSECRTQKVQTISKT